MTEHERLLIIGAIDDLLIDDLGTWEQFTNEERDNIAEKLVEVFDITSPKEIREGLIALARRLYEEVVE